jgi:hypothetical protein
MDRSPSKIPAAKTGMRTKASLNSTNISAALVQTLNIDTCSHKTHCEVTILMLMVMNVIETNMVGDYFSYRSDCNHHKHRRRHHTYQTTDVIAKNTKNSHKTTTCLVA